jgi:hypothetical protein
LDNETCVKRKPKTNDGYHARRCQRCAGLGKVSFGHKEIKIGDCFSCHGSGWKIAKNPVHSSQRQRPSEEDKLTMTKEVYYYRLKLYLLSIRGNKCEGCGKTYKNQKIANGDLDMHHVLPIGKGGSDDDENLMLLCPDCHQGKHHGFVISSKQPSEPKKLNREDWDIVTNGERVFFLYGVIPVRANYTRVLKNARTRANIYKRPVKIETNHNGHRYIVDIAYPAQYSR